MLDHEKLRVYQTALEFIAWMNAHLGVAPRTIAAIEQLDRASTSVALNIAEGNGKYSPRDRIRYLDIARGSALECAACLDVLGTRGRLAEDRVAEGKRFVIEIVSMLVGLQKSLEPDRFREDQAEYGSPV